MVGVSKPDHEEKPVLTKVFPIHASVDEALAATD